MKYFFGAIFVIATLGLMGYSIYSLVMSIIEHRKKKKDKQEEENK